MREILKFQFGFLLFIVVFELASAQAQAPPNQPILKIETGMHTARINDIRVDNANRILVTASDDGTARAWRLPDGQLINTFRVPIVPGQLGAVKTAAISPDGSVVALGGHTFNHILYLFDVESGQGIRVIKDIPDHVAYLVFSPDGEKIAVGYSVASGRTLKYKLDVFDGITLDYLFSPKSKIFSLLPEVAWSSDGEFLYAGGVGAKFSTLLGVATKTTRKQPVNYLYRWGNSGKGKRRSVASEAKNVITRLASLNDGGVAYVAIDPFIGMVNSPIKISKSSPSPNFATIIINGWLLD